MKRIPLVKPYIDREVERNIKEVLSTGRFVKGEFGERFKEKLKEYLGGDVYISLINSGTSALYIALKLLGLKKEDEVLIPSLSFPSPAHAISLVGSKVVLCDVSLDTWNIDPESLLSSISKDTKGVIVIDQFGNPSDWGKLIPIAKEHNLWVIEDSACALGSSYNGKRCGRFGRLSIFSFHPRKIITTGEGGAIVTDSRELYKTIEGLIDNGLVEGEFKFPGYNLRLGEINSAIGLAQLNKIELFIKDRRERVNYYKRLIEDRGLELLFQKEPKGGFSNFQTFGVLLPEGIDRDKFISYMRDKGIEVGILSYDLSKLPSLKDSIIRTSLKNCHKIAERGVSLPLYFGLKNDDIEYIVEYIEKFFKR